MLSNLPLIITGINDNEFGKLILAIFVPAVYLAVLASRLLMSEASSQFVDHYHICRKVFEVILFWPDIQPEFNFIKRLNAVVFHELLAWL